MADSNVLYALSYVMEKYGWDDLQTSDIMKHASKSEGISLVLNRGIRGCPKVLVSWEELEAHVEKILAEQEFHTDETAVFTQIPGITEEIQQGIYDLQIYSYDGLRGAIQDRLGELLEIKGLGPVKLKKIIDYLETGTAEEGE